MTSSLNKIKYLPMFRNRTEAGKLLAGILRKYRKSNPLVVALPYGGVPIGYEVAQSLQSPLDVLVARKISFPGNPECTIGAVDEYGTFFFNSRDITPLDPRWLNSAIQREWGEAIRRANFLRAHRSFSDMEEKTVIVVDDGTATKLMMRLVVRELKRHGPHKIVVAVPVAPPGFRMGMLAEGADEVLSSISEGDFLGAVKSHYVDFKPTNPKDVMVLIDKNYNQKKHYDHIDKRRKL